MKEEKLLHAIGGIDDELIEFAMEPLKHKRHPAWVRWTAAAACLCLLMASPVGAVMQGKVRELLLNAGYTDFYTTDRFAVREFSEEARAAAAEQPDGQTGFYPVDSLEKAEEFLGIPLPDNTVLEGGRKMTLFIESAEGDGYETKCMVHLYHDDGYGLVCADVDFRRKLSECYVDVYYRMATEKMPYENGGGVAISTEGMRREDYVTPGGLECVIYGEHSGDEFWGYECVGLAVVDRCFVWIRLHHQSQYTAVEMMKEILDAYG